jgi:hypothetical protein
MPGIQSFIQQMYSKRVAQGMSGSIWVNGEFEVAVFEAFDFGHRCWNTSFRSNFRHKQYLLQ